MPTRKYDYDKLYFGTVTGAVTFNSNSTTLNRTYYSSEPKIVDYKVINNKVVIVEFADGTTTKAVCDERDNFDLEDAIAVCIHKKLLGDKYHTSVKRAMKDIKAIDKKKAEEKEVKEMIARKKEKRAAYKKRRSERIRKERIQEMAEAFAIGMKKYDEDAVNQNLEEFNKELDRLSYLDQVNEDNE